MAHTSLLLSVFTTPSLPLIGEECVENWIQGYRIPDIHLQGNFGKLTVTSLTKTQREHLQWQHDTEEKRRHVLQ